MADSRVVLVRGLLTGAVLILAVGLAFAGWAIVGQRSDLRGARQRVDQLEADYKARGIPVPPPVSTTTTTTSQPARAVTPRLTTTTTVSRSEPATTTTRPSSPPSTTSSTSPPPSTTTTTACAVQLIGRCVP